MRGFDPAKIAKLRSIVVFICHITPAYTMRSVRFGSTYPDLVCLSFVMSSAVTNAKSIITPAKEQISTISLICRDECADLPWSQRQSVKFSHSYQLALLI